MLKNQLIKASQTRFHRIQTMSLLLVCLVWATAAAQAQGQSKVWGKVSDPTGQPLTGVTIVLKGTTNGTISDNDGMYSLNSVPEDGVLVFSFIGMTPVEVAIDGKKELNATLHESNVNLEEVVAVGYGTTKIRWGIGNKMKDQGKQIPWFTSSGTIKWMEYNGEGKAGFKEKHLLLPFPETEITLNPNVKQNPGW